MHSIKQISILFTFISLCFFCNANQKNITLRINDSFGPFEYLNKDGKPIGFTVDIFNAINDITHFTYQVKSHKGHFNFYSSTIDSTELVTTTMDTVPHNNKFIVSKPYGYIDNDIITRIDSEINTWNDIDDMSVLIIKDSPMIFQLEKLNIKPNFVFIKSVPDGLRLLSSGKYDAMISSNDAAYFYIKKLKLTNLSVKPSFCQPLALRFVMLDSPENRERISKINKSLQTIRSNGTYDAIFSKRFFPDSDDSLKTFELCMIIIGTAIMMVLIFYVLYIHWLYQAEKRKKDSPRIDNTPLITNLSKIYDSIPTVTVFFDGIGRIRFINKAGHDLVNASRRTRLHLGEHTLFDHTILNDEMIDNLKANKPINFTYNLISKDSIFNHLGDYVLPSNSIYNIFIMPIVNYGTILDGYMVYIYDITPLHKSKYTNIKYITSLSQISDNNLLDICYYDSEDNLFYTFSNNAAQSTGVSYEKGLSYIHPISRPFFIDEFLSILNGEKRTAKLTIKKTKPKNSKYYTCDVTLNAIRVDSNTTIGISIVTTAHSAKKSIITKNKDLENRLSFLMKSSEYQFFEYYIESDKIKITRQDSTIKELHLEELLDYIHPDDRKKATNIIDELHSGVSENAYAVIRHLSDDNVYQYYNINIQILFDDAISQNVIIGVYQNITENIKRLQEGEEFKENIIIACERNDMGYFEYYLSDPEHSYIPDIFTSKYGINDDNFIEYMDYDSRNLFNQLILKFNAGERNIGGNIIRLKSPITNNWIYLEFLLQPITDENTQEVNKYIGFINDVTSKYSEQQK